MRFQAFPIPSNSGILLTSSYSFFSPVIPNNFAEAARYVYARSSCSGSLVAKSAPAINSCFTQTAAPAAPTFATCGTATPGPSYPNVMVCNTLTAQYIPPNWSYPNYSSFMTFNSVDNIAHGGWHHLVFEQRELKFASGPAPANLSSFSFSLHNQFSKSQPRSTSATNCPLQKIYFCSFNDEDPVCLNTRSWVGSVYKNLKIWDANSANILSILRQDEL